MVLCAQFSLIWYATWLLSQKKYGYTFWPHPLGQGCVRGKTICYHVAANIVSFNLICNMTIFWKSSILASAPPLSPPQGLEPCFRTEKPFDMFHVYCCSASLPACRISAKVLTIALVIAKFKYLTFDPFVRVKGVE